MNFHSNKTARNVCAALIGLSMIGSWAQAADANAVAEEAKQIAQSAQEQARRAEDQAKAAVQGAQQANRATDAALDNVREVKVGVGEMEPKLTEASAKAQQAETSAQQALDRIGTAEGKLDSLDTKIAKKADTQALEDALVQVKEDRTAELGQVRQEITDKEQALTQKISTNSQSIQAAQKKLAKVDVNEKGIAENKAHIASLSQKVLGLSDDIQRTGALNAALAGLRPMQFDPAAPTQFMGAVGLYEGKQSYALGIAHYAQEGLMLHAGVAYDGNDTLMGNVGVTVKVGFGGDKHTLPARYQAGPISSIAIIQQENEYLRDQVASMQAAMAQMQAQLDMLAARANR